MAEDQGQRKDLWQTAPWVKLFGAFKVALDPKKLVLAGAGIFVMSLGWWVLAWAFSLFQTQTPKWEPESKIRGEQEQEWRDFKETRRRRYNLFLEMAGTAPERQDTADMAETLEEYEQLTQLEAEIRANGMVKDAARADLEAKAVMLAKGQTPLKPFGRLRTLPWFEYRGPNPYLLVTDNVPGPDGARGHPWAQGQFFDWLVSDQVPVLLEPLCKFLQPVIYFFRAGSGGWNRIYLFLVIAWTLAVWGFFGGAITRMAAVQVARHNEKIGMMDAIRFARERFQSFFFAPLFPLIFLAVITFFLVLFGLLEGVTWFFGDIVIAGLFWPLVLIGGLVMAVVLVGLVGWPLMYATISAEGSDSFDALSRSYSYVYQAPWHYLWYSAVAMVYGAVLVFFVGFMGSLLVYLGKWGVSQAYHPSNREPTYLFASAPTSFGWRDLLLYGSPNVATRSEVLPSGRMVSVYELDPNASYTKEISWNNRTGAFLVSVWLFLFFLLIVGFGYSYFWTAATIIYLLMRRKVDDTEMDEIHLDEEEDEPFAPQPPAPGAPAPAEAITSRPVMVEAPTLRTPSTDTSVGAPDSPAPSPAEAVAPPPPTDGTSPGQPL
jgi:hypothetical protein